RRIAPYTRRLSCTGRDIPEFHHARGKRRRAGNLTRPRQLAIVSAPASSLARNRQQNERSVGVGHDGLTAAHFKVEPCHCRRRTEVSHLGALLCPRPKRPNKPFKIS